MTAAPDRAREITDAWIARMRAAQTDAAQTDAAQTDDDA